jgi:CBS domain-containing protein
VTGEAISPVLRWIAGLDGDGPLPGYPARLTVAVRQLAGAGLDAGAVGRAIATANDALTSRLLQLAEARLGTPPCPYAWLTLGSGGRREESLYSDQDNAVAYHEATAGPYFAELAELAVAGLAAAGLPRCRGGYVATRWRYPLAEWERIFRRWVEQPEPQALVEAEVLLDFRAVHGGLSPAPLDRILRGAADQRRFTIQMARAAVSFAPPLGLFGRLRTRHGDLDLKRAGIAAIVLLARLYALAAGSDARSTADRLAAAAQAGTLSRDGASRLTQAHRVLTDLRLRAQVAADGPPGNALRLADLTPAERRALLDALRAVHDLQDVTARRYRTDTVT